MKIIDADSAVLDNVALSKEYFLLTVQTNEKVQSLPGHFFQIKLNSGNYPLLRRPLSILYQENDLLYFFYKVVGEGTKILSKKKKNDILKCLGPLGTPFNINNKNEYILVGGGTGIPPLYFTVKYLNTKIYFYYGAKSENELFFIEELEKSTELKISTDDGSIGFKGFITDLLKKDVGSFKTRNKIILTCGPEAMMKKVKDIAEEHQILCYGSLEERMACGYGICNGCPVKLTDNKYALVCKDGPVFNLGEIAW